MPLPPLLLARLKRRGIIKEGDAEEVIAENYDDENPEGAKRKSGSSASGCPNKWCPFHLCTDYCFDHWGDGVEEHRVDPVYNRKRLRMLRKYPLPESWTEVYDPGTGRYYYWNTDSSEVSWLSPTHPKAIITTAAVVLAKSKR
ncbi:unnamed protein product [Soboliphyme baturini]|uniref:WW domain-containing protein n=1 Tax=Soboliphyme baturini TaxID=241478 RepID=A0A183J6Z8_9BILA|nr:unnamed protein product [Soboliphyme baturini]